ncbi:MAG: preprotein translocase subunit SecG [Verrucomicrobia bacterium]|jgi:preprotein translocase subunit SecG|nr:preprotein translocase subunit SecG [Lachnospiraceae bacterium]MBR4249373.1 preprotein translocase subunit SecG [Verrucomicrobiota bacterium]
MEIARGICVVLLVLVSIALVAFIIMQKGKKAGLGALGGAASADTFWSQNKSRSKEGRLDLITKCLFAAFMVLALLVGILS